MSTEDNAVKKPSTKSLFVIDQTDTIKVVRNLMFDDDKKVLNKADDFDPASDNYVKIVAEFKRGTYKDTTTLFGKHFKLGGVSSAFDIDIFTLMFDRLKSLLVKVTITHDGEVFDLDKLDIENTSDAFASALINMMNEVQPFDFNIYAEYITSSISNPEA